MSENIFAGRYKAGTFGLLLFLSFLPRLSSAQPNPWACQDSSQIRLGAYCYPEFRPICGCDNVTYRNVCRALNDRGVQFYTDGPCEPLAFNFDPNPVLTNLYVTFVLKTTGDLHIMILDLYGKIYYEDMRFSVDRYDLQIDVTNYRNGLFMIYAETDGYVLVKKFSHVQYY